MKYFLVWLTIIISFAVYVYQFDDSWEKEMDSKYGEVYITRYGEKYHKSYHYAERNKDISMYSAYKRHYEPCEVCHPREMPYFEKEKENIPWYVKHWFISMLLFTAASFYLSIRWEEMKKTKSN